MQLNLKDVETYDLVKRLAERNRKPMAQVVKDLARDAWAKSEETREAKIERMRAAVEATTARVAEIIRRHDLKIPSNAEFDAEMYDDDGLPR